ncbi:uncharacterized protein LOC113303688 [Papaver somniferum]|uniref:uncharacterized protein LOC113303688 n=1 Tax=Papaver somniferum TaxID=3469 RepID=UPI000E6FB4ED|nr:uncharacterized protein LOC113303688 [Papaver somniferum]
MCKSHWTSTPKPLFRPGFSGFSAQPKRLSSATGGGGLGYSANSAHKSLNDELFRKAGTNYYKVVDGIVNPFSVGLSFLAYMEYKMSRPVEDQLAEVMTCFSEEKSSESEARMMDAMNAAVNEFEARIVAAMDAKVRE